MTERLIVKKEEKIQQIIKRAYEYAESGEYKKCLDIEHKLISEGFLLAEEVLDDDFLCAQLESICERAASPE